MWIMADNNNDKQNVDEIDLVDLFKRSGRAFSRMVSAIGTAILVSVIFLVKNWKPLLLSVFAGAAFSYLVKITLGPAYVSDIVIRTNASTASEMISYINKLHRFCLDDNIEELTRTLTITGEEAKKIRDISAYWIIDINKDGSPDYVDLRGDFNKSDSNIIRLDDRISIRVKTKSSENFPLVRKGLIAFIDSDSLLQQRNRVRYRQNREILARLDNDILLLDSLQKVKYFEESRNKIPGNGGQIVFLQEQKTQLVYTEIYDLYSRKQDVEVEITLYKDIITVLSDFTKPSKPITKTSYYAGFIIPIVFGLTIILLIVRRNKTKLGEVYNKV
jgi:hypothetical protein